MNKQIYRTAAMQREYGQSCEYLGLGVVMVNWMEQFEWEKLTPEQKKKQLYINQKELLDIFLEHHAISQEQYDKSLRELTEKMKSIL